jgi:HlyD family secretion protein
MASFSRLRSWCSEFPVRFRLRSLMVLIVILGCGFGLAAHRARTAHRARLTKAASAYVNAKLTREGAEIAVVEYRAGIYKQDLKAVEAEIARAKSDQARAEDRLVWITGLIDMGYVPRFERLLEDVALQNANFSLEQAEEKKKMLELYTTDKTIKELESAVKQARADAEAKNTAYEQLKRRGTGLW